MLSPLLLTHKTLHDARLQRSAISLADEIFPDCDNLHDSFQPSYLIHPFDSFNIGFEDDSGGFITYFEVRLP